MAIELATQYAPYVDEMFSAISKISLLTNNDFTFESAGTVKIYKVTTSGMNDYDRVGTGDNISRYGAVAGLDATTESFTLTKDRSFTFAIDKLDNDETKGQLAAASALARQCREVVVPEVDQYTYSTMCTNAGTIATAVALTADNIYDQILLANQTMDDKMVPETGRSIVVTPDVYTLMKKSNYIVMDTDIGADIRKKGVIGVLDGCNVIKVPSVRLPDAFGFMVVHPCATVAPTKLAEYKTHVDPPFISGDLVEGRIVYDAFVLENKAKAIYYQPITTA